MILERFTRKTLVFACGLLCAAFTFNVSILAGPKGPVTHTGKVSLQGHGPVTQAPPPGVVESRAPGLKINADEALLFSPYSHLYLFSQNGPKTMVELLDEDVGGIHGGDGLPFPFFLGGEYNLYTLNGMDLFYSNGGGPDGGGGDPCLAFSVGQDQLIISPSGHQVYVHTSDIAALHLDSGEVEILFEGGPFNLHGIDAVSVMMDGNPEASGPVDGGLVFSPDGDFFYYYKGKSLFFEDEDLAYFDFGTQEISLFLRGADLGISTLDAVDVAMDGSRASDDYVVYFSVRKPIFIYDPPNILYIEDGDVACYDEGTGEIVKVLDGNPFHVYNLDALSITEDPDSAPE